MPKPPTQYQEVRKRYRAVVDCYESLAEVCHELGPLPVKSRVLVKLGMAIGAGLEGAVHAHCRLALEAGWPPSAIRHVALLATTTLGFPSMMRAHAQVEDVLTGTGRAATPRPRRKPARGTNPAKAPAKARAKKRAKKPARKRATRR